MPGIYQLYPAMPSTGRLGICGDVLPRSRGALLQGARQRAAAAVAAGAHDALGPDPALKETGEVKDHQVEDVFIYVYTHTYGDACIYIYIYVLHICMYVFIYIYIY